MQNTAGEIENLLVFGVQHHLLAPLDVYVARNTLLDLFGLTEPCGDKLPASVPATPADALEPLLNAAAAQGLYDGEVPALRVNFEARIMGALMPRESEVAARFETLRQTQGIRAATDYFYRLCVDSNYIRTAQIAKNIRWEYASSYGSLEMTINLTKPEKDPKTIALERLQPAAGYPKCMLCIENIGYAGRVNFPARQTHRVVPLTLCGEPWYLQYSPYVYYNEHCIVFSEKHEPMEIGPRSFAVLFDFVRQLPHYLCGFNADLPIVGGSILSHLHFQGGRYVFPMQRAGVSGTYRHPSYPGLVLETLHWPVSTLRVRGKDSEAVQAFAEHFLTVWRSYSDHQAEIFASTEENGVKIPHNTVTPILQYEEQTKEYRLDLVPRNNRTTAQYPEGIFHPHREIHNIKKENIGLIEVMGLAILPARLEKEGAVVAQMLSGALLPEEAKAAVPVHAAWIDALAAKYGTHLSAPAALAAVRQEIGAQFTAGLEHTGVFKQTPEGRAAYGRFLTALGCKQAVAPV